jgi:two-component system sensor histidine kinase KdpD
MDPDVPVSPEGTRATARTIDREAERLSRLVRNMLDLGRIEGGALHPSLELYDLADILEPVVERMRPILAPSDLEIAVAQNLPAVRVDAMFIDQILTNLLENAARYAAGLRIRVSARQARPGRVDMVVEDAGPGVPASVLPRLFERFYRAPRRKGSRTEGGSGIGLAVVRGLAVAMGGSADARQSSLGGLAVVVRLPAEDAEPVEEATEVEPAAEPAVAEPEPEVEPAVEPTAEPAVGDAAVEPT